MGVLNSIRIRIIPSTLWQLTVFVVMIASGGGLMFRSLSGYQERERVTSAPDAPPPSGEESLRRELAELKQRLDAMKG